MAAFHLDYYCGKDLYSDGKVEDVIFEIVTNGLDYYNYQGRDDYFAIMYHLSPERENIWNWYPFQKSDSILEAGAGCGAVTGILCQKAGWVTSVELSKKRAGINYARHQAAENLEIMVGNLNEMVFDRRFDYVVLTGVFEYAASYNDSPYPYEDFLKRIKKYLNKNGKILIAIENRLGIKYFSGAPEDHTGEYYDGINGYPNDRGVRTFSKGELEGLFQRCKIDNWKFYYPYPDYKFPSEIFTDENVNAQNYGRVYHNFQKGRLEIFREQEMVTALKKDKIMGSFSNSFIAELCTGSAEPSGIFYAKLNNSRKEKYRIATVIENEEKQDQYKVSKYALHPKANKHIDQIYQNQERRMPEGFAYLKGAWHQNRIQYPYLKMQNLDSCFLAWMLDGQRQKIKEHIDRICNSLVKAAVAVEDFYTEAFIKYFGTERCQEPMLCIREANIDLIFDNLFWDGETYLVIDPEWTFDFWVPVPFVIWRMLNEWFTKYKLADEMFPRKRLFAEYGITQELEKVYRSWAVHFGTSFVSYIDTECGVVPSERVSIDAVLKEHRQKDKIEATLFLDYGSGFSENDKCICPATIKEGSFHLEFLLDPTRKIQNLRLDPTEGRFCSCLVEHCRVDGQEVAVFPLNADPEDISVFLDTDPQIRVDVEPGKYRRLLVSGRFQYLNENAVAQRIVRLVERNVAVQEEKCELEDKNRFLQEEKKVLQEEKKLLWEEKNLLQDQMENLREVRDQLDDALQQAQKELAMIQNSRGWKLLCFFRKIRQYGRKRYAFLYKH